MNPTEMKRYESAEWNFALDIPKGWHSFPPVASNSPLEVIRFASKEDGTHLVIIFRGPRDPKQVCVQRRVNLARSAASFNPAAPGSGATALLFQAGHLGLAVPAA